MIKQWPIRGQFTTEHFINSQSMDRDQLMITPIITNLLSTNDRTIVNSFNHSHSPITCAYFLKVFLKRKLYKETVRQPKVSTIKYINLNISQSTNNFPGHVFSRRNTFLPDDVPKISAT